MATTVVQVFRVEMFDLVSVPEEDHGTFFSGDCYVVLYAYRLARLTLIALLSDGRKDCYLIYYWLGAHSGQDEQVLCRLPSCLARELLPCGP